MNEAIAQYMRTILGRVRQQSWSFALFFLSGEIEPDRLVNHLLDLSRRNPDGRVDLEEMWAIRNAGPIIFLTRGVLVTMDPI